MTAVSVFIPVLDGGARLGEVLDALGRQQVDGGLEIVAVDSGSRDGSVDRLLAAGARVERIARDEFDHGATRNRGVALSRGRHVVFLSQDALPVGDGFLSALTRPLERDGRVAGAFARQVPRSGADACTRRDLAAYVAAGAAPRVVFRSEVPDFERLPPLEQSRMSAFDNVASAAPRALLLAHPFVPSRFGEDLEWGTRVLHLGYGLAYAPEAVVEHSHERTARGLYRRNYLGHRLLYRLFAVQTIPDRRHAVRAALGAMWSDARALGRGGARVSEWLRLPMCALCATYGQYSGARDERLGRGYPPWS